MSGGPPADGASAPMPPRRLEDYALIGDGGSAALVHRDGSIDWLCWPRFDSPACFAALLGTADHGHWSIAPVVHAVGERRYLTDTTVLETEYACESGRVRVTDFMPACDRGGEHRALVRIVDGLEGSMRMRHRLRLRLDYGRIRPWVEDTSDGFVAVAGADRVALRSAVPLANDVEGSHAEFDVECGTCLAFVLTHDDGYDEAHPIAIDVAAALDDTVARARAWIARFGRRTDWPDAVRRSLLTLRSLIDRRSGALVAAATTSLPEILGGSSNWDYRYCWLRDAAFTVVALVNAGLEEDAIAWHRWFLRTVGDDPAQLRIAYRVDGTTGLVERKLPWLPGYEGAAPVRIGNAAWHQQQGDVCGELLDAFDLIDRSGIPRSARAERIASGLVEHVERAWNEPGQGLWESRDTPRHYVYSKVMAWVGVDRHLRRRRPASTEPAATRHLEALRARIHDDVCEHGYDVGRGVFVEYYGSQRLDASLLLLPLVGFLPVDDPRIARTIDAIENDLMTDGLVSRHAPEAGAPAEGAFLACTCWLADCRSLQGRDAEARAALERVLSVSTDLGLLSEEYDTRAGRLCGNFPQALTHLAVVTTALGLSGPVLQRGGG